VNKSVHGFEKLKKLIKWPNSKPHSLTSKSEEGSVVAKPFEGVTSYGYFKLFKNNIDKKDQVKIENMIQPSESE
jgi:hypothetical protein